MLPPMLEHFLQWWLLRRWGWQATSLEFFRRNWPGSELLALLAQRAQPRQPLILRRRKGWWIERCIIWFLVHKCITGKGTNTAAISETEEPPRSDCFQWGATPEGATQRNLLYCGIS